MTVTDLDAVAVQRLLDRQAIVDLIHAYCRNVDLVLPDAVAELFTEDCVVDYGPGLGEPTHGSADLAARLGRGLPRFAATSHHVSNIQIEFDESGDAATGCTYLYAWHRYPDPTVPDAHLWAQYHDRFVRTPDGWRISERVLKVAGQESFDVAWYPIGRRR
jgi:ketosteroid isomerase-like protein